MIKTKADLKFYLQCDRKAQGLPERTGIWQQIKNLFIPPTIWDFTFSLRCCEYYANNQYVNTLLGVIYKIRYLRLSEKLGLKIP